MEILHADFVGSFTNNRQCPQDRRPEYAFIGRSNVGKSSLLNLLSGRKDLARVSKSPGKTQHLNFYLLNREWYLVDLPGYGYAKISKTKRLEWSKMIDRYLSQRQSLCSAFVLLDLSIPPQQIDLDFIDRLGQMQVPFALLFTKADKVKTGHRSRQVQLFEEALLQNWSAMPPYFVTSATSREGRREVLAFIERVNQQYQNYIQP
ncbi:MAG: ribosome biogenesis GTP-binding protein YihA/YsxC [Bacteroidota bacterium]|mgnify:CR=1 FL=1